MSSERINILVGSAQLCFAALVFFRIDHRIFRRFMTPSEPAPELELDLPIKSNRRAKIVLILICGGLVFSAYGFYRTTIPTREPVTEQNLEIKTREWLDAFHLGVKKLPNDPAFDFAFEVRLADQIPLTIIHTKEHEHYLTLIGRIEVVDEHRSLFDKLPKDEQSEFVLELRREVARAKVSCAFDPLGTLNFVIVEKRIPVTDSLTEAQLMEGVGETNYAIILIRDTISLLLNRQRKATPPL